MKYKLKTGKILKADAVVAKANGTLSCLYLSIVLVTSREGIALWCSSLHAGFIIYNKKDRHKTVPVFLQ
jgi:hypothetical protein